MNEVCPYTYKCKFSDVTCIDTRPYCRLYKKYHQEALAKKSEREELDSHHKLNDIGLVSKVRETWHEGKIV